MTINCPTIKPCNAFYYIIAAQMRNFAIYLPLMVGNQIPNDDYDWDFTCYC